MNEAGGCWLLLLPTSPNPKEVVFFLRMVRRVGFRLACPLFKKLMVLMHLPFLSIFLRAAINKHNNYDNKY